MLANEDGTVGRNGEPDGAWHAVYTRHQHEKAAAEVLSKKGFEIFLPLYGVVHRWKDRSKRLSLPLFPCYLFLRGGLERSLDIMTTPGVHSLVRTAGQTAVIPQAQIDAVRQLIESSLGVEPHLFLSCGDWVRVKSGPLAGMEGILVRKKNHFRLVLSVEMLGKAASVEVDFSATERVSRKNGEVRRELQ